MLTNLHRTEDMLAILFPHLFEDIEFLIPSDDFSHGQFSQPIAGPSRPS